MKRLLLTTTILGGFVLAGAGWVAAETPSDPHAGHHPAAAATNAAPAKADAPMAMGMMGGGSGMCSMMGGGGMGPMGAGGGMGSMMAMGGADTQVAVKNIDKGVTITLTATDPKKVPRLQKMAEAMRLMHEATAP